jgi:hypothetical protein
MNSVALRGIVSKTVATVGLRWLIAQIGQPLDTLDLRESEGDFVSELLDALT